MHMCADHWAKLKTAIKARGLGDTISEHGYEAAARTAEQLSTGKVTKKNFDALLAANNMITANAIDFAGLSLLVVKPDGTEHCPICTLSEHCERCAILMPGWIDHAADDAKAVYDKLAE